MRSKGQGTRPGFSKAVHRCYPKMSHSCKRMRACSDVVNRTCQAVFRVGSEVMLLTSVSTRLELCIQTIYVPKTQEKSNTYTATDTDVPWRFIGQLIIVIPGFCPDGPPCMLPADSAAGTNINITRTFLIGSPSWKTSSGAGKARNSPRTSPPGVGLPGGPVRSGLRRSYGSIKSCINPTDSQDSIEVAANLAKTTRLNWGSSTYRPENAGCRSLVATLSARSLKVASVLTLDCSSTDSETDADYLGCLVPGAAMMDPG